MRHNLEQHHEVRQIEVQFGTDSIYVFAIPYDDSDSTSSSTKSPAAIIMTPKVYRPYLVVDSVHYVLLRLKTLVVTMRIGLSISTNVKPEESYKMLTC